MPNGAILEAATDGSKLQTNPNGISMATRPDGYKLQTNPNGTTVETHPDTALVDGGPWNASTVHTATNSCHEDASYSLQCRRGLGHYAREQHAREHDSKEEPAAEWTRSSSERSLQ